LGKLSTDSTVTSPTQTIIRMSSNNMLFSATVNCCCLH